MIVGVFSPAINWCGGAERVAVNIINALKEHGHKVIVLSDSPINQAKFITVFNKKVLADQQIIFPLRFFSSTDYHNVYTDAIRSLLLKSKCEALVDTFSNAILPGVNVSYIHYPLLKRVETGLSGFRNKLFFYPYQSYLRFHNIDMSSRLILANSKFTAKAIKAEIGVESQVLYPSVSNDILNHSKVDFELQRENNVITVARISDEKNLEIIPFIAKSTRKEISFTIVGLLDSERVLSNLLKLINKLQISERIKILPNVKREQLRRLLLYSKVYLHPAINEHFGISIIEAMASGCIPVVHNSGGPREFVPQNQRFNSVEEAAEIVEEVMYDWSPTRAKETSEATKRFSDYSFSKKFTDIFNSHLE